MVSPHSGRTGRRVFISRVVVSLAAILGGAKMLLGADAQVQSSVALAPPDPESALATMVRTDPVEAPAGFDNLSNGMLLQGDYDAARANFDSREEISDGLGPLYNTQSCGECHQNPTSGGISQITELRSGHFDGFVFTEHPGGSLINDRAIDASIQERVFGADNVRTFRTSLNTLGDGFVEAISNTTIQFIASHQPFSMRGTIINVPVAEAPGQTRIGRFGWKNQQASLISFSADAYLNEMGITSPLQPNENTSNGQSVAAFDTVPDPEDAGTTTAPNGPDVETFAAFMRSATVPPRDLVAAQTADAIAGQQLFTQLGCNTCHVDTIVTAPAGTVINGGAFVVPDALGNKIIHPYSDFLLHDVGTGDGVVQNGGSVSRNKMRTPPLWGMRTRDRLMHDGASLTRNDAILRHDGQAHNVVSNYNHLSNDQKNQLVAFLNSL